MVTSTAESEERFTFFPLAVLSKPANDATSRAMLDARVTPVDRARVGRLVRDFCRKIDPPDLRRAT